LGQVRSRRLQTFCLTAYYGSGWPHRLHPLVIGGMNGRCADTIKFVEMRRRNKISSRPTTRDRLAKAAASIFGVPRLQLSFVAEAGALVTDGCGTLIATRSCLLNANRNPVKRGIDRQCMIEAEMVKLGIRQVIWLEGDPCESITSGHTDGYVLCAPGRDVLVETIDDRDVEPPFWREHDIKLLEAACDANGQKLKVMRVVAPRQRWCKGNPESFAACYLNAYLANGAVISACFGDDERVKRRDIRLPRHFRHAKLSRSGLTPLPTAAAAGCIASPSRCRAL
jgi:agmatine deiminase